MGFVQVWTAVRDGGHALNHNWVIKADADAVFFPSKLLEVLQGAALPAEGVYMENRKFVDWGYFGNLEVFSKQAFATLVNNLDTCYTSLPWKVGVHGGKYGPMGEDPMGEDLFAQKCMDLMGVAKQENFGLTRWTGKEQEVYPYLRRCLHAFHPSLQEAPSVRRVLGSGCRPALKGSESMSSWNSSPRTVQAMHEVSRSVAVQFFFHAAMVRPWTVRRVFCLRHVA